MNIQNPDLNKNTSTNNVHKGNMPLGFSVKEQNTSKSTFKELIQKFSIFKGDMSSINNTNTAVAALQKNSTQISTVCIYIITVLLLAWAMPALYTLLFEKEVAKTAIFFSPTDKKMVYTEQLRIDDPIAMQMSENHHADIVYKDEEGNYYNRLDFEAKIPFLYFRNMEMRGLLPIEIDGQSYDRARI